MDAVPSEQTILENKIIIDYDDQKVKIRDQLETRGLEAARDHEMLELEGTPQDIVDFRRNHVPGLIFHACPECGDELRPEGNIVNLSTCRSD
mgnify:CR=1 FL=1